ncbi:hypothetical protein CVT25_013454 [Psilocybe cyanescens]|uniref:CHAT domain-containing protein n=1 Tax=Psilocybe cyanescens TaxID=93625 RepID=A0A409WTJ5_PSICY|nr:hypothetical protein CVT25_013454 [Psilocybe cyanescens]
MFSRGTSIFDRESSIQLLSSNFGDFTTAISKDPEQVFFVVLALSEEIANKARFLHDCGGHLPECFPDTDNGTYCSKECSVAYDSAINTADGNTSRLMSLLYEAGLFFLDRYSKSGTLSVINEAISKLSIVVKGTLDSDHKLSCRLNDLGRSLLIRFEHEEDLLDVTRAISYIQKAISVTVEEESPTCLNNLGHAFCLLFETTGNLSEISDAISYHQRAVQLTPEDHRDLPRRLNDLGHAQLRYHERTGDLTTISEGIAHLEKAILLTSDGSADLAMALNNLGNSFRFRFECTGSIDDLSSAIANIQESVRQSPEGNPRKHTRLSNLGNCFVRRFERTGDLMDISQAIMCHQKAVNFTSEVGHPEMPVWLNNLSLALKSRFERTGDLADIAEAISYLKKGVQLAPETHPSLPIYLNNLGNSYRCQFQRTGNTAHITEAITYLQKAVEITPEGHLGLPIWLNNLGLSTRCRFEQTHNPEDIDKAIAYIRRSVLLTPAGHTQESTRLTNLGVLYGCRFTSTGEHSDIAEAVDNLQKAIKCTPEDHATLASLLKQLGDTFSERGARTGALPDIHVAISNYSLAATCSAGPPSLRLIAALQWAELSRSYSRAQLLDAYRVAIDLVSQLAGFEQTIQKRYINLLDVSNLSASAAAAAFEQGRPELAIEWLEQGRCLVWSQLNDLRTPLDDLRAKCPALADELLRVSVALDNAGAREEASLADSTLVQRISLQDEVTSHVKLARERDGLLKQIRYIPGFETFLQPLSYSTLVAGLPQSGTAVIINVHTDRCDAVALRHGMNGPVHIPLPGFSYIMAENLRKSLKARLQGAGVRVRGNVPDARGMRFESGDGRVLTGILKELWLLVVNPILEALGFMSPSNEKPPSSLSRIWWCATGPLAFLPIHAAGRYGRHKKEAATTLSHYAISSYIPTVRTLVDRVKSPLSLHGRKSGLFLVSQADTPNLPLIPGASAEVRAVKQRVSQCSTMEIHCLESVNATIIQSLQNMDTYSCVHFACHASQNTADPLRSAFYLHDGQLDLSSIIQKRLENADLAFLSACQTSAGDEKLSEEAVHLAAGMLAAGYRGVVATMWSIQDRYGAQLAEDFYEKLVNDDSRKFNSERAACSLHFATQKLRNSLGDSESSLLIWVPYVHFGL